MHFLSLHVLVLTCHPRLSGSPKSDQLQSSDQVLSYAKEALSSCPTSRYVVVSQPNIHAADIRGPSGCNMPRLCRAISSEKIRGRFSVAEVIGQIDGKPLANHIRAACQAKGKQVTVSPISLEQLPSRMDQRRRSEFVADQGTRDVQLLLDIRFLTY
jgi:hypothetical protein